jgi:hypothetical protein
MKVSIIILAAVSVVTAQQYPVAQKRCMHGFHRGFDTVFFTVPYPYDQVMSIIGDFKNITWSGVPYDSVTLNGTDNTVGTARTYELAGAQAVETITKYSKPPKGPYEEVHTLNLLTIAAANLSTYATYDGTTVTSICSGAASTFTLKIKFCATNVTLVASLLHTLHLKDAQTVGVFLGGQTFSSYRKLSNPTPSY